MELFENTNQNYKIHNMKSFFLYFIEMFLGNGIQSNLTLDISNNDRST